MDIDEFYVKTQNQFGRMQKLWFLSLALFNFYAPFHMIQVVFTGPIPNFQCTIGNATYNNTCGDNPETHTCDKIEYDPHLNSFVEEWGPSPCNSHVPQIVQMAYMLGVMLGALTLGPIADRFGRKTVLIYTLLGMICFGAAASFFTVFIVFIILRFLTGVCGAGNMVSSFVLSSELIGPSVRGFCGNMFQCFFAFGIIAFSGLAYLIDENWRILSLASALLGIVLVLIAVWIPESPRWLYAHGHTYKGRKVLERLTGTSTDDVEILTPQNRRQQTHQRQLNMCDMFRVKYFMVIVLLFSWFTNSMVYYALTLSSHSLGNNLYVSTALSGFVEVPAYILTTILIERLGRKPPLVMFMVVAGASCIALQFVRERGSLFVGLLGKLSIAASFSIIYIHSSELFPTVVRNSGVGLCSSFARVGGVAASAFVSTSGNMLWQMIGLGIVSVVSGLLNLTLPETNRRKLPETIEDLNRNEVDRYSRLLGEDEQGDEDGEVEEYARK